MSDAFRFGELSSCKASDSEEEFGPEDEGLDGKSDLSSDEAEGKMPLSVESGYSQCKRIVQHTHSGSSLFVVSC